MHVWIRVLASLGCVFGAGGVALAAAGAHITGGGLVTTAANFLRFHAGALVALSAAAAVARRPLWICIAASLVALGVGLFAGDLALRGLAGVSPLRLAAPTGGMVLIAGWLVAAIALPIVLGRIVVSD